MHQGKCTYSDKGGNALNCNSPGRMACNGSNMSLMGNSNAVHPAFAHRVPQPEVAGRQRHDIQGERRADRRRPGAQHVAGEHVQVKGDPPVPKRVRIERSNCVPELTVMVNGDVISSVALFASVTVIFIPEKLPATVAVPLMTPGALSSDSPAGSAPAVTA